MAPAFCKSGVLIDPLRERGYCSNARCRVIAVIAGRDAL